MILVAFVLIRYDGFDVSNRELLKSLFKAGRLRIDRGPIFDRTPEPHGRRIEFDRIEGMLLGLAIGDALGRPTEGLLPAERQRRFGEIRHYLPLPGSTGEPVGLPTDDTQLAFWMLEQILEDGQLDPAALGRRYLEGQIFGIGASVRRCLSNLRQGVPWYEAGPESAGNGALMRIAPVLIPHLATGGPALWADTALAASLTHNDSASIAACLAFVSILWELLAMERSPPEGWWLESYLGVATELEKERTYRPRLISAPDHQGRICDYVAQVLPPALHEGLTVRQACDRWGSGAYLLETLPSVLFILTKHAEDPEEAIARAINDTRDNDTIGAIVGAAVGALHGARALPPRWRGGLLGRTRSDDDGRVFELIGAVRATFWLQD